MRTILLTTAFAALAGWFYLASGGAEFAAPQDPTAPPPAAAAPEPAPAPRVDLTASVPEPAPEAPSDPAFDAAFSGTGGVVSVDPEDAARPPADLADAVAAALAEADRQTSAAPVPITTEFAEPDTDGAVAQALGGARRTVTGSRVNLRGGPGTGFDRVGTVSEGEVVEVLREVAGWAELRTAAGQVAWMSASFLR